jgi:hypothetical protein
MGDGERKLILLSDVHCDILFGCKSNSLLIRCLLTDDEGCNDFGGDEVAEVI